MPNEEKGFKLYPRGFLGGDVVAQVERTKNPYGDSVSQLHYTVGQRNSVPSNTVPNPKVESLYATLIKNTVRIDSPEFRTNALETALSVFGTQNFLIWFVSQYTSPAAGSIHSDFLLDTLKFISTGSRNMALETWSSLIVITDEGNNIGKIPEKAKEFFGLNKYEEFSQARSNVAMIDVIQSWCSKSGGLMDMVGTMHILFGGL